MGVWGEPLGRSGAGFDGRGAAAYAKTVQVGRDIFVAVGSGEARRWGDE